MDIFLSSETWIALITLTFLEIVLGVDNIIFISIVSNKLPEKQQPKARIVGLSLALIVRILLLLCITWIISFKEPFMTILSHAISGRDVILAVGGIFLISKSVSELHHKLEGKMGDENQEQPTRKISFSRTIIQIILLDMVFSFDSILTAIGLSRELIVMIIAVVIAIIVMMIFAGRISKFISSHPTLEILALSFLILIGFMLVLDGAHYEIPKGYIYFAVFFSLIVEIMNIRLRKVRQPLLLKRKMRPKNIKKNV